ncbi:hypothetical protein TWF481_010285 [Arthrobotrys musiformis]|uniref:Fungal-type protein kinase domain-containing protein n=1 Tax=Arthrobotrys musiformis TaxID=47236 RepID=A0AAV9W373_9PEZI
MAMSSGSTNKPPAIRRPKTMVGRHLTHELVREAFDVEYYRVRTGSWRDIDFPGVVSALARLKFLQVCFKKVINPPSPFQLQSSSFSQQPDSVKEAIYQSFLYKIQTSEISAGYRAVALDMLSSTAQDHWLYIWIGRQVLKSARQCVVNRMKLGSERLRETRVDEYMGLRGNEALSIDYCELLVLPVGWS